MPNLPVKRMVLYKHGVGFFERYGSVGSSAAVTLTFKKEEMNDILKSLAAFPQGEGHVVNVSYETPEEKQAALAKAPIVLSENEALLDLVRSLRGRAVRFHLAENGDEASRPQSLTTPGSEFVVSGCLVGVDQLEAQPESTLISIMTVGAEADSTPNLRTYPLSQVRGLDILDPQSGNDLRYVLELSQAREDKRSVTVLLDRPNENLLVTYVAPTPTWRVSYRLVYTPDQAPEGGAGNAETGQLLIQGWGIVDNQLDEDLENVSLTLIAGQPISFVYDLYTPRFIDRPQIQDEERTVPGPVMFQEALMAPASMAPDAPDAFYAFEEPSIDFEMSRSFMGKASSAPAAPMRRSLENATQVQATGVARGELFQYDVGIPVTIKRGQSAMVPILGATLAGRKQHLFNSEKLPDHPVVTISATNTTGLILERGPATVLEADNYVGEAVLAFTSDQGEFFVPYAVDLGVQITPDVSSQEETAAIAFGQNDYLIHDWYRITQTTYTIENRNPYPIKLVIEQRIHPQNTLFDTPEPVEITAEFQRWRMTVPARNSQTFIVKERQQIARQERVSDLSYETLQRYLDEKFIDKNFYERLHDILDLYQQVRQIEREVKHRTQQQERFAQQQQEAADKLNPLGRDGEEGNLRRRFVAKIQELEDECDRLLREIAELQQQVPALQQRIRQQLQRLG
ncbi:hypothetical protein [Leptolyngbya sp. FACHB-16]|uniref:hypothetical protein n=1 Tax=unclassified Leptolyngbya TaxID=2650499 RepID=UPI001686BD2E|nr:hypothetical protein [Leptolyngbya sp. FACHB-16]MBD2157587.1 hypothetical protein [Leptolyngbya sp. FACHB-16]